MLTKEPVVQIHLSRFCNLQCLHCYSSSGPSERQSLRVEDVLHTTGALADAGYQRASLSGGEPVLAPGFRALAAGLTAQGFRVSVITNGTRPDELIAALDVGDVQHASISFDGPEDLHDVIRNKKGSFRKAMTTLERLANASQSTGAVLSATKHSLPHLPDLVDSVCSAGAAHVQLHPIASAGRARGESQAVGPELPSEALLRLVAMGRLLQFTYPAVQIQVDVLLEPVLRHIEFDTKKKISPLVIADDGAILPFCYDISRDYALGRLRQPKIDFQLGSRLKSLLERVSKEVSGTAATYFYREIVSLSKENEPDFFECRTRALT